MFVCNRRFALGVLALAGWLLSVDPGRADEDLYRNVASSTALVYKSDGLPGGASSGFLIDAKERLVVTARHVVENFTGGMSPFAFVVFSQSKDGEIITDSAYYRNNWPTLAIKAQVVYESVRRDLAILKLEMLPAGIKALPLATDKARPAQNVHVVGNSTDRFGAVFSYSRGNVRNVFFWEEMGARVVATQVPANKGDSGGPMVNDQGEVVGLVSMSTTGAPLAKNNTFFETQVTEFSVCVTEIREALKEMRDQKQIARGSNIGLDQKKVTLKGEARIMAKSVFLEKDVMVRILVKADGFVPDLRIDNNLVAVTHTPAGAGFEMQHLFTPKETKEYRFQVGPWPGRDIGKGVLPYTLTIDQVTFAPESTVKERDLKLNEHVHKFEAGKVYEITIKGKGFEPDAQIVDESKSVLMKYNYGNRAKAGGVQDFFQGLGLAKADYVTTMRFVAPKSKKYRILVSVSAYSPPQQGALNYTIHVAEGKALLSVSDQLTAQDPIYAGGGPFKVHAIKLEAGKSYQMDLITTAFDSRLVLEDSAGKMVLEGYDAEGFNAGLVYQPTKTAAYRLVATAHQADARGSYTVLVSENPDAQGRLPRKIMNPGK